MQALGLINRALWIHTIYMRGNNGNLGHTSIARFVKVGEVATASEGQAWGEPLCAGLGVHEGGKLVCCILSGGQRGDSAPRKVGFVEKFEVGGGVGGGDLGCRGGNVGRVHADGDLGCV